MSSSQLLVSINHDGVRETCQAGEQAAGGLPGVRPAVRLPGPGDDHGGERVLVPGLLQDSSALLLLVTRAKINIKIHNRGSWIRG